MMIWRRKELKNKISELESNETQWRMRYPRERGIVSCELGKK